MTNSRETSRNPVTIVDVAEKAGVSYSTVSRVLNDAAHVKEATRKRVKDAVEELGYVANQQARSLRGGKTSTIGLIIRTLGPEYMSLIARGIDVHLAEAGYDLLIYTTNGREEKEVKFAAKMMRGMVDGLLLILPLSSESYLGAVDDQRFPCVIIDESKTNEANPAVVADNFRGAYDATSHLIANGHRDIAIVKGDPEIAAATDRLAGYLAALQDHDIKPISDYIADGDFFQPSGYEAGKRLLNSTNRPTAILASNDVMAFGVMEAARELGVKIPNHLSLIGFDDILQAVAIRPTLTTVRQPLAEMGQVAAQMVLKYVDNPNTAAERIVLPMELVVRESSGPALSK